MSGRRARTDPSGLDQDPVRARQHQAPAPREDHPPRLAANRTRSSPTPLRHRAPARLLGPCRPTTNANDETAHPAGPGETASTGPASTGSPTIATTNPTGHQHTRLTRLVDTCGDNDHRRVPLIGSATVRLLPACLSAILDLRRSLRAAVTHSGVPRANAQPHRCATPQRESLHPRA